MNIPIYQVDAFADKPFKGNPAAVCPLTEWISDEQMQQIAMENNLSETAFFVENNDRYHIRWFTPAVEINLCGHATLASAHVIFEHLGYEKEKIHFDSQSGELVVRRRDSFYEMNFPAWIAKECDVKLEDVESCLVVKPEKISASRDLIVLYKTEEQIRRLTPDFIKMMELEYNLIVATAKGDNEDFVSRVFVPKMGIPEDPVTGSAHSTLIPFWADILGKTSLKARQLSQREGYLECEMMGDRVLMAGQAFTFLRGEIRL